uniref:Peroxiredoxin OsmC n=1 Tax=uncultured Armatimonadetes bacterium TaxID=157466 RepID=A0A6J4I7W4_9BACT|nr:Peroxiredoxin OsmC [uncultured Armatimonadetes bacterium]
MVRTSEAEWKGDLKGGQGTMKVGSGAYEGAYSFRSRFEEGDGTNPEELIAAAHAGCFSMALSHELAQAGFPPERVHTRARVSLEPGGGGFSITTIALETEARVPNITPEVFQEKAEGAKKNCPVSKALAAINITLQARLV